MFKDIFSYNDLSTEIVNFEDCFLLLYKPESENCQCAIDNVMQISGLENRKIMLLKADVTEVKDLSLIHI